jgi:hypothetical protein
MMGQRKELRQALETTDHIQRLEAEGSDDWEVYA